MKIAEGFLKRLNRILTFLLLPDRIRITFETVQITSRSSQTMGSLHAQRRRELFFERIPEKKIELSGLSKLTAENHPAWALEIESYLTTNQLADFLTPKTDYLSSYALRQERLLGELIMSTVSDSFAEVYLKEFKFRLFSDLWCELDRCCKSPVNALKPALNELQSIKRRNCDSLKDYCEKFESALNQIPIEFLDQNLHNIMSIFYGPNVHLCCKRLAEQNSRLILPKEKLRGARSVRDARGAQRIANRPSRPPATNQPAARPQQFDQTRRTFAPQTVPAIPFGQANRLPAPYNHHSRQHKHARFPPPSSPRLPFTQLPDRSLHGFRGGKGVHSPTNQPSHLMDQDSPVETTSKHLQEARSCEENLS